MLLVAVAQWQSNPVPDHSPARGPLVDGYHRSDPGSNPGRYPRMLIGIYGAWPIQRGHQSIERLEPSFTFARSRAVDGWLSWFDSKRASCSLGSTEERRYHKPETTVRLGQGVPMLG